RPRVHRAAAPGLRHAGRRARRKALRRPRQRIALARAFLKDSPVLILDEPTSSVDAKTEAAIVDALERLKQGRTVIVISHRPTTLAGCSAFLTVDGGRVVAQATPAPVVAVPAPPAPRPPRLPRPAPPHLPRR